MGEFSRVFRVLVSECYVPAENLQEWTDAIADLDYEDVMRNIRQYRDAKNYGIKLTCNPEEVREECLLYHGYDKYWWHALQEIREEYGS